MKVKKPGMWKFMLKMGPAYAYYEKKYQEFLGPQPNRKKNTYEERREAAIKAAVARFGSLTPKEYLYAIVKATSL